MNQKLKIIYLLIVLIGFFALQSSAASRYFKSGATTWNNANNWSATSSAGVDNAGVPTSVDIAYFDSGSGSCSLDVNINVAGINTTGYLGTITQNGFTILVGSSGLTWASGTFAGGTNTITVGGSSTLAISGGTFTSTSSTLNVMNFNYSGGTWNHNNGMVRINSTGGATITNGSFYNLNIDQASVIMTITNNMIVYNDFTLTGSGITSGSNIEVRGNITFTHNGNLGGIQLIANGTGNQTVSGAGNCGYNFEINKASGTLTFTSNVGFQRNYTYTAGTLDWGTNTATFLGNVASTITSGTFYNLTLQKGIYACTLVNDCNVNNNLLVSSLGSFSGANMNVYGNMTFNSSNYWSNTNFIVAVGSNNQSVSGSGSVGTSFEINKSGGTLSFTGNLSFERDYKYTAGTVDWSTNTATIKNNWNSTITSGNFYNLTINKGTYSTTLTNNCIINNIFTISGMSTSSGSNFEARGDIAFNSSILAGSSNKIIANGTGTQNVTANAGCGSPLEFEINKAGGTLNFNSDIKFNHNYTLTSGTVNWGTYKATFAGGAHSTITNGSFYNMEIAKSGSYNITISGANCIVSNAFTLTSISTLSNLNIEVRGDLALNHNAAGGTTAKLIANGTGNQAVSGTACAVPFEINKASGTLTFNNNITFYSHYTYTVGTVNWGTYKATLAGGANSTITNGSFYDAEVFKGASATLIVAGTDMVVSNALTLNTTSIISGLNIIFGNSLIISANAGNNGSSSKIMPASTGNQTISGAGSLGVALEINKSSGSVTLNANFNGINSTYGDFNLVAGTFNQNGFNITTGKNMNITGGTFNGSAGNITCIKFIQTGGVFTSCSGTLQIGASNSGFNLDITGGIYNHNNGLVKCLGANHSGFRNLSDYPLWNFETNQCPTCDNSGTIYVDNNILITSTNKLVVPTVYLKGNYTSVSGDMDVVFIGGNNQTVTGAHLGSVTINKTGGTLTFNSDMIAYKNWNHNVGTIIWNNHKITSSPTSSNYTFTNASFYDLTIQNTTSIGFAGMSPTITHNLIFNAPSGATSFAPCTVAGDVIFTTSNGSMSTLTLNGTGTQNLSGAGTCNASIDINKSSGKVVLGANLVISGAGNDLLINDGELDIDGYNVTVPDLFTVSDKLTLKGTETITVNSIVAPATNVKFSFPTGSTVEFKDSSVTGVVSNLTKTYYNLILCANKTHEFATGAANRVTVNGLLSTNATNATRSILRSVSDAASTWELRLLGTSFLEDKVDVKYSDASSGLPVWALGSVDSTNNTNWNFVTLANFTWKGTVDNNWSTAGNWEGGVVPGATDTATFVSSYSVNCTIDAAVNVSGINVTSGYTGTITQGAFNITVGAGNLKFSGGTFNGSGNSISVTGTTTINGGTFTSTSGTFTTAGFYLDGGTYDSNNGTFTGSTATISGGTFNGGAAIVTHSGAFLQTGGSYTNSTNGMTATTLTMSGGNFSGSSGNITLSTSFAHTGGVFTSTSGILQVPSANATVFSTTNGTFNHNNGTVKVQGGSTPTIVTTGFNRLYHLTFTTSTTISGTIYADGNLDIGTPTSFGGTTAIYLKGDYIGSLTNTNGGTLNFVGSNNQSFTANKAPTVVINKTGGTLSFSSSKTVGTNWNHAAGTLNWNNFGITFPSTGSFTTITNGKFYDLTINNNNSNTIAGSDCVVSNNLTLTSLTGLNASVYHIKVGGNVDFTDAAYTKATAAQKIILNGAGTQNITGAGICGLNLEINKSAGVAILGANLSVPNANSDIIITAGDFYLNGFNVTVARNLTVNAKLSLKGNETITVNSIVAPATNANFAINTGSTVEFKDSAVTGVVTNVAKTFHHLTFGASKTHEFDTGASNRVTVNGTLSSAGNSGTRSILRALGDAAIAWELKLNGTSGLTSNVDVKYSDASSGNTVMAMGSVDSGNNINWAFNTVVSSITSSKTDGSYKAGVLIPITVNFNVAVTVTGTPTLTLETGGVDQTINYVSGSGSSALLFNYTVQAGDTSLDLDYVANNSLSLNGGTIKNVVNDDANLTLPNPGAANSLGANKALIIDNTAPTVTSITSSTANGSYKSGANISVRINFSESITVTGTLGLNMDSGGVAVINAFSGTTATGTYTVGVGQTSADLTATSITVNATACDAAFNNLDTTLPGTNIATGSNIIIDTTTPTITSITSSTANGAYGIGSNISIRINFSEVITLVGTMGINLDSGGVCIINPFTGTTAIGTYSVGAGQSSSDLNASSITVTTTARDAALNDLNLTLPGTNIGTGSNIVVDGIMPVVTSITSSTAPGVYDIGGNISIRLNFSKPITLTGTIGVNLDSGGVCVINGFSGTTVVGTYTVLASENSSALICNSISVTGSAVDAVSNPLSTTVPVINISNTFAYHKTHLINSAAGAGTGYQVKITVYYGAGVDAGSDVYLNNNCQTDFEDVYFTSSDQSTYLSYWLEEKVDSNYAIFWVKINDNISSSNATIYLKYGNANLASQSNPHTTFLFFDGFAEDLSKWSQEVLNGSIQIPAGQSYLRIGGGTTVSPFGFSSLGSSPTFTSFGNNAVRLKARSGSNGIGEVAIRGNFGGNTGYKARFDARNGEGLSLLKPPYVVGGWNYLAGASQDTGHPTVDTWYTYELTMAGTDIKWYQNNTLRRSASDAAYGGPGEIALQSHYGSYTDFDWIFVRKFVATEPAHGAWGGEVANNISGNRIIVDTVAPTITSIKSSTANGAYKAGANISVRINFSEQITLSGTMGISLDSGGLCVIYPFTGTTAVGTYTVLASQNSNDLTASSVTVNTSAVDIANKNLNLALPGTNIATNSNIVVDTTVPTITSITSSTINGSYKAGANISIRINFSEVITLTGTLGINLDSGGVCVINGFTGTTALGTYTVLAGHSSTDLTATSVTVNTSARDAALNNLSVTLPGTNIANGSNLIIDTTAPTITSINSSTANGNYKAGANISIQINFSEVITLTGTMGINLNSGGVCVIGTFTGTTASGTYTVLAGHSCSDLTATSITVNTSAQDAALNNLNTTLPGTNIGTNSNIVIDAIVPTITSITSSTANGSYKSGAAISVRINFSEQITLTGTMGISLNSGGVCVIGAFIGTTTTGTYTVLAGHNSSDLTATSVTVNTSAQDAALNNLNTTLPSTNIGTASNIIIDTTVPTIASITSSTIDGSYKAGDNIAIRINFSEPITVTGTIGINLNSGGVCVINGFTGTTATGTYTVLVGHSSADLTASSITVNTSAQDAALNDLNLGLPGTNIATNSNIIIDTSAPTITSITSSTANGSYKASGVISVRINFNSQITLVGTMNINLDSGGTVAISAFTGTTALGSYTVLAGHNSSDLTASSVTLTATARDAALNDLVLTLPATNIATNSNIIVDTTAPTITSITSSTANGSYKLGDAILVRINFSESITLVGTMNVNLDTGGVASISAFSGTTAVGIYTVQAGHTSSDLTATGVTVSISARDNALNNLDLTLPGTNIATNSNIVIDTTAPTITSITSSTTDGTYSVGANIAVRINFSEMITVTGTMGLNLDTGGVVVINGFTGTTVTGTYTVLTGQNSLDLAATSVTVSTSARDAALNNLNLTLPGININTNSNIVIDSTLPTITSIQSISASGYYRAGQTINLMISFSEPVTLASGTLSLSLTSGGTVLFSAFSNATSVSSVYTVLAGENTLTLNGTSVSLSSGSIVDASANVTAMVIPATNISPMRSIVVDTTAPLIDSQALDASLVYLDVTFDEGVYASNSGTGSLNVSDFTLVFNANGGTATNVTISSVTNTSGGSLVGGEVTYRLVLAITGIVQGVETITINPATNAIFDRSGNPAPDTSSTGTITLFDQTAPTITNVTSTKTNGSYKAATAIDILVTFSETMSVTGTPAIKVGNGGLGVNALYVSGTGSNTLTFNYIVLSGDNNPDLDYMATTSLQLNGGTIKDSIGNNASLVLPTPGASGSLGFNKAIIIDTVAPTIVSGTLEPANAYVDITFSEGVYAVGSVTPISASHLLLSFNANGGTATGVTIVSLTSTSGGALVGGETVIRAMINITGSIAGIETISIQPNTNSVFDKAGNVMLTTATTNSLTLVKTGTTPTVVKVYGITADGTYGVNKSISIAVQFSEAVAVTGIPYVQLETGPFDRNAFFSSMLNANTLVFVYQVVAEDGSIDLEYVNTSALSSGLNLINSLKGIPANVTLPAIGAVDSLSFNSNIVIDTVKPTIISVTTTCHNGLYGIGVEIPIQLTLSRRVILSGGSLMVNLNSGAKVSVDSVDGITINIEYITSEGEHTTDLNITSLALSEGATIKDEFGNDMNLTLPGSNLMRDYDIKIDAVPLRYLIKSSTDENGLISPEGDYPVNAGSNLLVRFSPKSNYHVAEVLVDGKSVGAPKTYTFENIQSDHTISVTFAPDIGFFEITAKAGAGGTISPSGIVSVEEGSDQTFTFIGEDGFQVSDVIVDGVSIGAVNSYQFSNVLKNYHIEAVFVKTDKIFLITANKIGQGVITPIGHQEVKEGTSITYLIKASEGSHIRDVLVDGVSVGAVNFYSFNDVDDHHDIKAIFEKTKQKYQIASSAIGGGSISPNKIIEVEAGGNQKFEFTADEGYQLINVIVDGEYQGALPSIELKDINENHTIEAIFHEVKSTYTIAPSVNNGGVGVKVTFSIEGEVPSGSSLKVTLEAEIGYAISGIKLNGKPIQPTDVTSSKKLKDKSFGSVVAFIIENVQADYLIDVTVEKISENYTININSQGNGSLNVENNFSVASGSSQAITFTPDIGYHLGEVIVNGEQLGPIEYLGLSNIQSNYDILVVFSKDKPTYTITSSVTGNGLITPVGATLVEEGDSISYTFVANSGFQLVDLIVDDISLKDSTGFATREGYILTNIIKNHSIDAIFKKMMSTYKIKVEVFGEGSSTSNGVVSVLENSNHLVEAIAKEGYHVSNLIVDGQSMGAISAYQFENVLKDHEVEIYFGKNKGSYEITIYSNEGGSSDLKTTLSVNSSESLLVDFIPLEGYRVLDVTVDGVSKGPLSSYLFNNVQGDHTVEVKYVIKSKLYSIRSQVIESDRLRTLETVAVEEGETVEYDSLPTASGKYVDVKVDGVSYGPISKFTFNNVAQDHKIVYIYEEYDRSLTPVDYNPAEPVAGGCQYVKNSGHQNAIELILLMLLLLLGSRLMRSFRK